MVLRLARLCATRLLGPVLRLSQCMKLRGLVLRICFLSFELLAFYRWIELNRVRLIYPWQAAGELFYACIIQGYFR